jgi:hypothetical protein
VDNLDAGVKDKFKLLDINFDCEKSGKLRNGVVGTDVFEVFFCRFVFVPKEKLLNKN